MGIGDILFWLAAFANVAAGILWVKSTVAKVKTDTPGMGAMLGGEFVWKDEDGDRIDLGETLVTQARWNKWAARSAAAGAILAAMAMIVQSQKIGPLLPKCVMLCS